MGAQIFINFINSLFQPYKDELSSDKEGISCDKKEGSDFKLLTMLPGVGNKTASVYQNEILNLPRIAVDTHVYRVSNRIGLVKTKKPDDTQEKLESIVPKKWLKSAHHLLILHGRYTCKSQNPLCRNCSIYKG